MIQEKEYTIDGYLLNPLFGSIRGGKEDGSK